MNHQEISQLIKSMDVKELNRDTFEEFVEGVQNLVNPQGSRFEEYFSPGYNSVSAKGYDWSKDKPEFRFDSILKFIKIEHKEIVKENKKWINVYFSNETHKFEDIGVWGIPHEEKILYKFGFDSKKALYLSEHAHNGTLEQPWETLHIKLD
jgi:hypothetical protein